jgi:hypothetical protein
MQFKEEIAVYSENHTQPFLGKMQSCWLLKQVVHVLTTGL